MLTKLSGALGGIALAALPLTPAGCEPDPVRYVDLVFDAADVSADVAYASAPDLRTGVEVTLALDVYTPAGDTATGRPAIVWIHGGGFRVGSKAAIADVATAYARRGYVTVSVDYRLDPDNRCQDVQDGVITDPVEEARERRRCQTAILAAQHDTQAAIRWLRAHAADLGVDPDKFAAGGFSAGAMTAVHVAQRSEDSGDVGEFDDEPSAVRLGLAASGYNADPASIAAGDAPIVLVASEFDRAIPFDMVQETETLTRAAGVDVGTLYFPGEQLHAKKLYSAHQTDVDALWVAFLVEHLDLA